MSELNIVQTTLRLPEKLHLKFKLICLTNDISINDQIIKLIEMVVENECEKVKFVDEMWDELKASRIEAQKKIDAVLSSN